MGRGCAQRGKETTWGGGLTWAQAGGVLQDMPMCFTLSPSQVASCGGFCLIHLGQKYSKKHIYAEFWKIALSLTCVDYTGILWLCAVRICACGIGLSSHILSGPFCNQQIEVWFKQWTLALLESCRVRNGWGLKGPLEIT